MKRQPRTFKCPKCGDVRVEPLANAVMHPCPQTKTMVEFKEIPNVDQ